MGTRETRRPAQVSEVTPTRRLVSEPRIEFLESPRIIDAADGMARRFHPLMLSLNATGVKRIPPLHQKENRTEIRQRAGGSSVGRVFASLPHQLIDLISADVLAPSD